MRELLALAIDNWRRRRAERREDPPLLPGLCGELLIQRIHERWQVVPPPPWRRLFD